MMYSCVLYIVRYPTVNNLIQIKWKEGKVSVIKTVSKSWRKIADLVGLADKVDSIGGERDKTDKWRCEQIFNEWIKNDGHKPIYPVKWESIFKILRIINEPELEKTLRDALLFYNIPCDD